MATTRLLFSLLCKIIILDVRNCISYPPKNLPLEDANVSACVHTYRVRTHTFCYKHNLISYKNFLNDISRSKLFCFNYCKKKNKLFTNCIKQFHSFRMTKSQVYVKFHHMYVKHSLNSPHSHRTIIPHLTYWQAIVMYGQTTKVIQAYLHCKNKYTSAFILIYRQLLIEAQLINYLFFCTISLVSSDLKFYTMYVRTETVRFKNVLLSLK